MAQARKETVTAVSRALEAPPPKRLLVCGSRHLEDEALVREWLLKAWRLLGGFELGAGIEMMHGASRGADQLASDIAVEFGWDIQTRPAQWDKHGAAAGPIRNAEMLDDFSPNLVLAFPQTLANSPGTNDMVKRALLAGVAVLVVPVRSKE